jgi:PASTA domain
MTAWQISPGAERVELKDGQAEVVFTVTNPGPVDKRATVDVVGSEQAQSSWFKIAEPQQLIPHGGSKQFMATVKPDEKAPAGTHWLAGRVYSADAAPEEDSVTSDRVTFEIKPPAAKPKPKWWLWASIAAGLLAIVIGVVLFLVLPQGGPKVPDVTILDVTTMAQDEAKKDLEAQGLVVQVRQVYSTTVPIGYVISQDPPANKSAKKGSTVTISVSSHIITFTPSPCAVNPQICLPKH